MENLRRLPSYEALNRLIEKKERLVAATRLLDKKTKKWQHNGDLTKKNKNNTLDTTRATGR